MTSSGDESAAYQSHRSKTTSSTSSNNPRRYDKSDDSFPATDPPGNYCRYCPTRVDERVESFRVIRAVQSNGR